MSQKYRFNDDYSEGAHPRILEALSKTNFQQEPGYGEDSFCVKARALIRDKIGNDKSAIHFVSGGTQANLIVLAALMRPYEAVISATTGHINGHEAGAVEATGHKILAIETQDGKLTPAKIEQIVAEHHNCHMVKPRVVFLSHSTELGTIYSKRELIAIAETCKKHQLYLYIDGARLASALVAKGTDITLKDLAEMADVFYIGGTKNGALFGEAIVINNVTLQDNFTYYLKQHGALLSKGRVLGIQFVELLQDDLFLQLAQHANAMAEKLASGIQDCGYTFMVPPVTNLLLPILPNDMIVELQKLYAFSVRFKINNDTSAIRLITSWATEESMVEQFVHDLKKLRN